jgi:hypothetical protein
VIQFQKEKLEEAQMLEEKHESVHKMINEFILNCYSALNLNSSENSEKEGQMQELMKEKLCAIECEIKHISEDYESGTNNTFELDKAVTVINNLEMEKEDLLSHGMRVDSYIIGEKRRMKAMRQKNLLLSREINRLREEWLSKNEGEATISNTSLQAQTYEILCAKHQKNNQVLQNQCAQSEKKVSELMKEVEGLKNSLSQSQEKVSQLNVENSTLTQVINDSIPDSQQTLRDYYNVKPKFDFIQ